MISDTKLKPPAHKKLKSQLKSHQSPPSRDTQINDHRHHILVQETKAAMCTAKRTYHSCGCWKNGRIIMWCLANLKYKEEECHLRTRYIVVEMDRACKRCEKTANQEEKSTSWGKSQGAWYRTYWNISQDSTMRWIYGCSTYTIFLSQILVTMVMLSAAAKDICSMGIKNS